MVEAVAVELIAELHELGVPLDEARIRAGAILHDCGKIAHPEELAQPGHAHEAAGREFLLSAGYPEEVAGICITHAQWHLPGCSSEELLVALADKLWKGKREDQLEALVIEKLAAASGRQKWEVFDALDTCFERIAARGHERLLASRHTPLEPL